MARGTSAEEAGRARVRRVAARVSVVVVAHRLVAPTAEAHAARGLAVAPPRVLTHACATPCRVAGGPSAAAAGQARVRRVAARVSEVAMAHRLVVPASDAHATRGLAFASPRMLTLACAALSAVAVCAGPAPRRSMAARVSERRRMLAAGRRRPSDSDRGAAERLARCRRRARAHTRWAGPKRTRLAPAFPYPLGPVECELPCAGHFATDARRYRRLARAYGD